jgi:hypothetical protein
MSGSATITFFFSFLFFSFPTSRFEPSWPKLNDVMSFWFCIRFDFHFFNCYLSYIESYFYLFFVPFHPLVFSFIFFSCQIWSLFFYLFFSYYFLNWICFSVSLLNISFYFFMSNSVLILLIAIYFVLDPFFIDYFSISSLIFRLIGSLPSCFFQICLLWSNHGLMIRITDLKD